MKKNSNNQKMNKLSKIVLIFGIVIGIIGSCTSVIAVTYLYNANEISYSNTSSGLSATNVQDALDQVYLAANDYSKLRAMIYPVGSIYLSITDDTVAKVESKFGGTWVKIEGRFLLGSSSSYSVNSTGGSADAIVVSHKHTFTGTEVTSGGESQNHTHSVTAAGTVSQPTFTGTSVNTSTTTLSGTVSFHNAAGSNVVHGVSGIVTGDGGNSSKYRSPLSISESSGARSYGTLNINATHYHTVTAKGTVSKPTFNGSAVTSVANNRGHTHKVTAAGTISTEGSSGTGKNMPPYYVVHIYKRTA